MSERSSQARAGAEQETQRYQSWELVGSGGAAKVFRVYDRDLDRYAAIKVLNEGNLDAETTESYLREARLHSQLCHPNIIPVYDVGVTGQGQLYLSMQYVENHRTLKDVLEGLRRGDAALHRYWTFERRVELVRELCEALDYVHNQGYVHCDLKPQNIMIDSSNRAYLVDWGIAAKIWERDSTSISKDMIIRGSFSHMAPEQAVGDPATLDQRTDIFSMSVVLYEFLSLHYPFAKWSSLYFSEKGPLSGEGLLKMLESIAQGRSGKRQPAEKYWDSQNKRVPRTLSRICERGLRVSQASRWQSMASLAEALQQWTEGRHQVVCPGTGMQRLFRGLIRSIDRRPVLMPALLVSLGAGLAACAAFGLSTAVNLFS